MSEIGYINFTYKSPHQDIDSVTGINSDGSVNVKYTLLALRELLSNNLIIINKLIDKSNNITNISPVGYGVISINIDSPIVTQNLIENNIIKKTIEKMEDDVAENYFVFSDEEETNNDRLNIVKNLVTQNDVDDIFDNNNNDSESDYNSESDDLIGDDNNTKSILDKYIDIINEKKLLNDDFSDDSEKSEEET